MNIVLDDAVEVRLATKSEPERRRKLGTGDHYVLCDCPTAANVFLQVKYC